MLTKQESIEAFDFRDRTVVPDRLTRQAHGHYVPLADAMLQIYQQNVGQTRRKLHQLVGASLRGLEDCPTRRIAAFCKLLDDASEYHRDKAGSAARLRQRVFTLAAGRHPLVTSSDQLFDHCEQETKQMIAAELKLSWSQIEDQLFADVIEFHRLKTAPQEISGTDLLARYNVAQTQATLYGAISMTVWSRGDFKTILRYAKLARLMHRIDRHRDAYCFQFDGPASVVRNTRRYGVAFAKFLPGLLAADDWRMQAVVLGPRSVEFSLRLSSNDGLRSPIAADDFDSQVEESFATQWQQTETAGWTLRREATVLHEGQTVFLPDFTLVHPQHGEALLEIVGFWTPEYLREKAVTLRRFQNHGRLILAVAENVSDSLPQLDLPTVTYKTRLLPKQILELLNDSSSVGGVH